MPAFTAALEHLARFFLSRSPRPVPPAILSNASRSYSKYNNTEDPFYDPYYVVREPGYPLHHEHLIRNLQDGFHIRFYMAGVGKEGVKLWIEDGELIAEGVKVKDFDYEDDASTNTLLRYRMLCPDDEHYNLDAIKAEINDGMLKVFVPRRDPSSFVPRASIMGY